MTSVALLMPAVRPNTSTATIRKMGSSGEDFNFHHARIRRIKNTLAIRLSRVCGTHGRMTLWRRSSDLHDEPVIDLRRVSPDHLTALLDDETSDWRTGLDWDFRASADLVRRFVHLQALNGSRSFTATASPPAMPSASAEDYQGPHRRTCSSPPSIAPSKTKTRCCAPYWTPCGGPLECAASSPQLMMLSAPIHRAVPRQNWFRCYPPLFHGSAFGPGPQASPRRNPTRSPSSRGPIRRKTVPPA